MAYKISCAVIIGMSLAVAALASIPASAAPTTAIDITKALGSGFDRASFWGWPYPYGYTYRRCSRVVRVRTDEGWRWQRVWTCR